jgi:beta-galactosidase GanA
MSGSFSWAWSRSDTIDSAILLEAEVALEYSRTALDLRRLAKPIIAFHKVEPQVAMLYSHCSTPYRHLRQMQTVYEGLFFEGTKVTFISDRQAEQGRLERFKPKLLIVPAASHVSDQAMERIKNFADNGGMVLLVGGCFKFDQRGKLREKKIGSERMKPMAAFDTAGEARTSLKPWLEKLGTVPPVRVETTGSPFPVVEWRYAKEGNNNLVYLLNMGHKPVRVTLWKDGKKVEGKDLIDGNKFGPAGVLKSLDVRLVKF